MRKTATIVGSVALAALVGTALLLRPRSLGREHLPEPSSIPAPARQAIKAKMGRHDVQMQALVSRLILLDADGVARVAGEIFDEPSLARPIGGDELNGLLPERFFVLQDELRARARRLVTASANKDRRSMAEEFGALAKSCVDCHATYLYGESR